MIKNEKKMRCVIKFPDHSRISGILLSLADDSDHLKVSWKTPAENSYTAWLPLSFITIPADSSSFDHVASKRC